MYTTSCRLDIIRRQLKYWCLDKRLFWGINWKLISDQLQASGANVTAILQGNMLMRQRQQLVNGTALRLSYWNQRVTELFIKFGDTPSKFFYQRVKQR